MQSPTDAGQSFEKLVALMNTLRENCPWDKKQTIKSLQKYTIEELYELMDAINEDDISGVKEELGDVLFHTIFYSRIASETDEFTITEVIDDVHEKLVRRHPHIFGDTTVENEEDVKRNWEAIKLQEGKKSVLAGVPNAMPALLKAYRMQQKAQQVGFDWENQAQVWEKINEEMAELQEAIHNKNQAEVKSEFGDLLFSIINLSRFLDVDPESSLELTNKKFKKRFQYIERKAQEEGIQMETLPFEKMEKWWNESKVSVRFT